MKAATLPVQRPPDARLLVVDGAGRISHHRRSELAELLVPGDLVVANDAATLPASLSGRHVASGAAIEVRLAGSRSLATDAVDGFSAVVFGAGDWRTRTEDRPLPPPLRAGDGARARPADGDHRPRRRRAAPGRAALQRRCRCDPRRHRSPRPPGAVRAPGRAARAVQDVWTTIAAQPVAFEAPSAGFILDWRLLGDLARRAASASPP